MAFTSSGLANDGRTTHYKIEYDDSLSDADGKDRAEALMKVCEEDFSLVSGWFDDISLTVSTPITVRIAKGGYASASWGPPITLKPGNGSSIELVRYLLVSELTEMFMLAQDKGWFGAGNEGSAGEGLSRFLAQQFLMTNRFGVTEPGFSLANHWMRSDRKDYVNDIDVHDHGIDPKTGCAILFIYYLHTELGYNVKSIVAAAASDLAGVYRNLTGDPRDPFPAFKRLLDTYFPGTTAIPGGNPDNPFPLGPYRRLPEHSGDLDGDGQAELLVTSGWGIGIMKQHGDTMTALMLASNGTRFGGWLLNTEDDQFGPLADYDGDGQDEILVTSRWGIGFLKLSGGELTSMAMAANGNELGGWNLQSAVNQFGPAADFDGDGTDELLVSDAGGIGLLKLSAGEITTPMHQSNGARLAGWRLETTKVELGPAADYDGDGAAELFVTSPWGAAILRLAGDTMTSPMIHPNGTRFGGWRLGTPDNVFGPAADFDGDGAAELLVTSRWGIGMLKLAGDTMTSPMIHPNGTRFGGWRLETTDNHFGLASDYDGDGVAEVFVKSGWGVGILKLSGDTMTALMMHPNGTRFGGWWLNTAADHFVASGPIAPGGTGAIAVTSGWGLGILRLASETMNSLMLQPNGTRFGGWLLDTNKNTF